ncbi:MAG: glycosyltransferase [Flavobacterium sp.]|nr:MAG: glycosyltransferase [Flavobacterium sp.]
MIKVLWVAHEGNYSGANIAMIEYIKKLKDEYISVVVLPHCGNMQGVLEGEGINYVIIPHYNWAKPMHWWQIIKWSKILIRSIVALRAFNMLITKKQIDLVFTNTILPYIGSVSALIKKKPHSWFIHEFGFEDFGFKIGWSRENLACRWMQKSSKLIVCNSYAVAAKFSKMMPSANLQVIYQPVTWKMESKLIKEQWDFLMFGQIVDSKGHMEVLEALKKTKEKGFAAPTLHIIGTSDDKQYYQKLKDFILENALGDKVSIYPGFYDKEKIIPAYKYLIVASKSEAFGRVIIEAQKAGKGVIVRNSGGAVELVDCSNGIKYDNAEHLERILSSPKNISFLGGKTIYDEDAEIIRLKKYLKSLVD